MLGAAVAASLLTARALGDDPCLTATPTQHRCLDRAPGRRAMRANAKKPRANCSAVDAPPPSRFCAAGLPTRSFAS